MSPTPEKMRYGFGRMSLNIYDMANKMHAGIEQLLWYEKHMPLPSDEYTDHAQYTDALTGEVFSMFWYESKRIEEMIMKQRMLYNSRVAWNERKTQRKAW